MGRADFAVPEIFVSGLDRIDMLGANARYVMFAEDRLSDGKTIYLPCLNLIMPNSALPDAISKAMRVPCAEVASRLRQMFPLATAH